MPQTLVEAFMRDGFIKLPGAVPEDVVADCVRLLWTETGLDPADLDRTGRVGGRYEPGPVPAGHERSSVAGGV